MKYFSILFFIFIGFFPFFIFLSFSEKAFACTSTGVAWVERTPDECKELYGSCSGCVAGMYKIGTCTGFLSGGAACSVTKEEYQKLIDEGKISPEPDIPPATDKESCDDIGW